MERIVSFAGERVLLRGTVLEDTWEVLVKESNGHRELSFKNAVMWEDTGELCPPPFEVYIQQFEGQELADRLAEREQELAEKLEKQREKNAQRAKSKCRWIIKSQGLDELLTLTYRENQGDRALCKKHFETWVRRMKAALGGKFIYCASFERQERGAMHVHVACHKLPSHGVRKGQKIKAWKLGTDIWRSIIGEDNGLCFVGGKTRHGGQRRNLSLAKLAAYVSKYIMKDYHDSPAETNRYSRSNGLSVPKARKMTFAGLTFGQMVELAFECADGDVIVSHRATLDQWSGGRYWLVTEPDPWGVQRAPAN